MDQPPRRRTRCPRCGKEFVCGPEKGEKLCWCAALPAPDPPTEEDCLCRDCLVELKNS